MPNEMSNENERFGPGGMHVAHARKQELIIPESAKVFQGAVSPGRAYEIGHSIINRLDPADPFFNQEMARAMGLSTERQQYVRDRLGLYSASTNFAESLMDYGEIVPPGTALYELSVQQAVAAETLRKSQEPRNNTVSDADRQRWRADAERKIQNRETSTRDELDRNFGLAVAVGNRSLMDTLLMLESFVPPKPFEANMQERNFNNAKESLEAILVYYKSSWDRPYGKMPERIQGWFRIYDGISEQQTALFKILCASGGGMEGYYDTLKQAGETLISRARYHASMYDFRAALTNDNPGVTNHKLTGEALVNAKDLLASQEIRELHVEMLSHARRLGMFNVDASQIDVDKLEGQDGLMNKNEVVLDREIARLTKKADILRVQGNTEKADQIQKHIDAINGVKNLNFENHKEIMRLVFGEMDKTQWITWKSPDTDREITTPREILTWYSSGDKLEAREEWMSKMLSMMTWKSADGKHLSDALETANEATVMTIAKEIIQRSFRIRNNIGDKVMNADPEFAAAKIALISWLENDKGFQTAGPFAWKFNYQDIINNKNIGRIERVYDSGGLYKAYDSVNLWGYWMRWAMYKAGWKSATAFFGPASNEWRFQKMKHSPDWLPPLSEIFRNRKIARIHERYITGSGNEAELWRAKRLTGNKKLTWEQYQEKITNKEMTPANVDQKFVGSLTRDGWTFMSAYGVPIPMYLPKTFKINVEQMMYDKGTKDTLYDLYRAGVLPMDIDWENYNFETLDRMWVSMSMLTRFAKYFVDSYEAERDPQYIAFFKEASPQSLAEMAKRVYLAFRDLPEGYQQYIVAIVPFMIAQNAASQSGILSTDLGNAGTKEKTLKKYALLMGQWVRAAMWMPQVIADDEQLYNGANADIKSMRNDIALMILYYKDVFIKVGQAAFGYDANKLSDRFNDIMSQMNDEDMQDIYKAEGEEANLDFGPVKITPTWSLGEPSVIAQLFGEHH